MNQKDPKTTAETEGFVRELTQNQNRIFAYVFSLVGDHARAADIVQETNMVLWRKIDEFDVSRSFLTWAFSIARFQVLAHLRDSKRDKMVLDDELVQLIGHEAEEHASQLDSIQQALKQCLTQLSKQSRDIIESRYFHSKTVTEVAEATGKTVGAMKVALQRVRKKLGLCIQTRISQES